MLEQLHIFLIFCIVLVIGFQIQFFFDAVFAKSVRKPNRVVYFIIFAILNTIYLTIPMSTALSSMLALLFVYSLAQSYQVELQRKVIFTILYAVLMTIVNLISLYIFYMMHPEEFNHFTPLYPLTITKSLMLSCIIMFVVIQVIRLIAKRRSFSLHYRYYILFLLVPIISIYKVHVLTSYSDKNFHYFISVVGFLCLNVLIVYIFDHIIDKFQLIHENSQLQQQMDYQDANYEKTVHNYKSIKRIIHDTNQHFLYIEECIKRNELAAAKEHIKATLNKIEGAYHRVNTGNLVVDALITNTLNIGQANGIRIDTKLQLASTELAIDRYDLCVVLGNMLDNAIEASKKISIAEERYMMIKLHSTEYALFIQVHNHTAQEVTHLHSQKTNPESHGIGLTNISRICDRYGGNMSIEAKNKTFNNMVMLPFYTNNL